MLTHGARVSVTAHAARRWGCTFRKYAGRVGRLHRRGIEPLEIRYRNGDSVAVRDDELEAAPAKARKKRKAK